MQSFQWQVVCHAPTPNWLLDKTILESIYLNNFLFLLVDKLEYDSISAGPVIKNS